MTKAFIFDLDGVLIADERTKHDYLQEIWPHLVGEKIASVFRVPVGQTPFSIHAEAVKHGATISQEDFMNEYEKVAQRIYTESPLTENIDRLGSFLIDHNFSMGLVSSARKSWMDMVLSRLSFGDKIQAVISINDHPELKPKPHPGGYIEAIETLGSTSDATIILEDSNSGIQAAKGAGAFVIGFTANLLPEYTQHGADLYANDSDEVIRIVMDFDKKVTASFM